MDQKLVCLCGESQITELKNLVNSNANDNVTVLNMQNYLQMFVATTDKSHEVFQSLIDAEELQRSLKQIKENDPSSSDASTIYRKVFFILISLYIFKSFNFLFVYLFLCDFILIHFLPFIFFYYLLFIFFCFCLFLFNLIYLLLLLSVNYNPSASTILMTH